MATRRIVSRSRKSTDRGPYAMFLARLRELGCVYCPICRGYAYPDHVEHSTFAPGRVYEAAPVVLTLDGELDAPSPIETETAA